MVRFSGWCTFLVVCGSTAWVMGRPPLIDPPTPPPCAADGTCYPKTAEWGYYEGRWRTWPGVNLEPTPATQPAADGRISPELGHSEPPPAELEDAAAPPSSPRREEPAEAPPAPGTMPPGAESGESAMPSMPRPSVERPSLGPPPDETMGNPIDSLGPSSDNDPPPSLPRAFSATTPSTSNRRAISAPRVQPSTPRVSTNDPPPSPPWAQSASL